MSAPYDREAARAKLGIGSTVWRTGLGYRHHEQERWEALVITGETSRSWVIEVNGWTTLKLPKRGDPGSAWAFSQAEVDAHEWARKNRHRIVDRVGYLKDPFLLREVADLIGYVPKEGA